jgi:flagellar hook-basal body complex protein FliE
MMNVNGVKTNLPLQGITQVQKIPAVDGAFKSMLTEAINKVDAAQKESELLTSQLVTGEVQDVHQVMIASQKASLTLQLTVQVRNKVIESYQEIMRMQV